MWRFLLEKVENAIRLQVSEMVALYTDTMEQNSPEHQRAAWWLDLANILAKVRVQL